MRMRLTLLAGIAAVALAPAALAQENLEQDGTQEPLLPPAQEQYPADLAPLDQAPPPAEAIIEAQRPTEMRVENLIGATVINPDGEEVGKVKDVLFDTSGAATGIVLSVGGILGVGAKDVGLNWEEVDMRPEPVDVVRVNYSKAQLEAAPPFKTAEAQAAEESARQPQVEPLPAENPPDQQ
ncbi:sporulation protein YlmC with PRC-barrel domain [Dongia mobilis]|uniref:Sporulation protein YlmC with PRC-barrel domain n=1 Tax=Dongia mobilis TaxID=578943 RepID=A0A4R6WVV8_9PROT|nr:PRC-barrel domain-containing protein [Dongia mobilis]TDQ84320.1 sporulation protein YlmC with PRC-barrel domain [Dongia mobilis]